jgi:GTP-binding protein Era
MDADGSPHKSGFVAVAGCTNVGKSTLINRLLGTKIAAVSPWPQTTRKRQLGILTLESAQIIFVDTPGIHKPLHKLGERMNQEAVDVIEEADLVLLIVDVSQLPTQADRELANQLSRLARPLLLVLNKIDLVDSTTLQSHIQAFQQLLPQYASLPVSAARGDQVEKLIPAILERLPDGPPFYPSSQLTDLFERDFAADLVREAALNHLRDEVPHSLAVRIDEYRERGEQGAFIAATLFVERESQKGIVIGVGGSMLKKIGSAARQEIEAMSGRKVFLQLKVKVRKNWRNDEDILRSFGYGRSKV